MSNVSTQPTVKKHGNNVNGTAPKPAILSDEKPAMEIQVCPQSVQPADRNLVHVTKAQMKGDAPPKWITKLNTSIILLLLIYYVGDCDLKNIARIFSIFSRILQYKSLLLLQS